MSAALRRHWPWLLALCATGLAAHLALARGWTPAAALEDLAARVAAEAGARGSGDPAASNTAASNPAASNPAALPCFGCHSYARYWDGARFKHAEHTGAGHCHSCHAFAGHHEVTLREAACEACHAASGLAAPLPRAQPARGPFAQGVGGDGLRRERTAARRDQGAERNLPESQ